MVWGDLVSLIISATFNQRRGVKINALDMPWLRLFLSKLGYIENNIAKWTALLLLLVLTKKPGAKAFLVENMLALLYSEDSFVLVVRVHADGALVSLELIRVAVEHDGL